MDTDRTHQIVLIIRCLAAVFLLIGGFNTHGLCQPKKEADVLSLTLSEAVDLALSANRSLRQVGYGFQSQTFSLQSSHSEFDLKLKPASRAGIIDGQRSAGVGLALEKKFDVGIRASFHPKVEWTDDEYTGKAGVSMSIPLLRGLGRKVTLDHVYGSQFSLRSAERSIYTAQVNVVLETISAVYDIKKQLELVTLFEFQGAQLAGHAETARIKERVGLASPIDIYRAEIRLKDAEDSLASARESVSNARDRLKLTLSLPLEKEVRVSAPSTPEPIKIDPDEAAKLALHNRIELEQRADDIREAERRASIAKHNLLPQMDLVVDYDRFNTADEFRDSMNFDQDRWAIHISSDTDWARTNEKVAYRQSLLALKTTQLNLDQTKDEIKREVRRQLQLLDKSMVRIGIRRAQLKQADGKLSLAKLKFNYDMADNFDVIEAETERQRAKVDLLSTEIDYIVGTYRMRSILGTLIDR
jgi:outer membrane protein TolC